MGLHFSQRTTFGVEIESNDFSTLSTDEMAEVLTNNGVSTRDEGYNHRTRSHWKIVGDGSCGVELVSPPLSGTEGLNQVRKACDVLSKYGSQDKRCGVHVHHDVSRYNDTRTLRRLLAIYGMYEEAIDSVVRDDRRESHAGYARSIRNTLDPKQYLEQLDNCNDSEALHYLLGGRYYKINLESINKHGTVEFRQLQGTFNPELITAWIVFTQSLLNWAKDQDVRMPIKHVSKPQSWIAFSQRIGTPEDTETKNAMHVLRMERRAYAKIQKRWDMLHAAYNAAQAPTLADRRIALAEAERAYNEASSAQRLAHEALYRIRNYSPEYDSARDAYYTACAVRDTAQCTWSRLHNAGNYVVVPNCDCGTCVHNRNTY